MLETKGGKGKLILEAAVRIFSAKGFHAAKIEDIAHEAGIGKGTVYEYFSSKEELFLEMFKEAGEEFHRTLDQALLDSQGAADKLRNVIYHQLNFLHQQRNLSIILWNEHFGLSDEIRRWVQAMTAQKERFVAAIFEQGIASGEFRPHDPLIAARALLAATGANGGALILEDQPIPVEKLTDNIFELLFRGIRA